MAEPKNEDPKVTQEAEDTQELSGTTVPEEAGETPQEDAPDAVEGDQEDPTEILDGEELSDEAPVDEAPLDEAEPEDSVEDEESEALTGDISDELTSEPEPETEVDIAEPEPELEPVAAMETPEPTLAEPAPQVIKETVVQRKAGFMPVLIGGILAGGVGFGAGYYNDAALPFLPKPENVFETETTGALSRQADTVAAVETAVATLSEQTSSNAVALSELPIADLGAQITALQTRLAETSAAQDAALAALSERIGPLSEAIIALQASTTDIDSRLTAKEKEPLVESVSPEVVAAYERELRALQATVSEQADEIRAEITEQQEAMVAQRTEVEDMIAAARAAETSAVSQAALAQARAALSQLEGALEVGAPFDGVLEVLERGDYPVAAVLKSSAVDGISTQATLVGSWPDAAREALRTARAETETTGNVGGFLKKTFNARSLTPQEGNSVDAVLSRAEAALKTADLDRALTEIAALPEGAQAKLADWVSAAQTRHDALLAADAIAQTLNAN